MDIHAELFLVCPEFLLEQLTRNLVSLRILIIMFHALKDRVITRKGTYYMIPYTFMRLKTWPFAHPASIRRKLNTLNIASQSIELSDASLHLPL